MVKTIFGTDGARGVANRDLTPELVLKIVKSGGYLLSKDIESPFFVVGKDTRCSGDMIEGAVIAGLCSVGASVINVGILPTAGIAYLTRRLNAAGGIVISASHNPIEYNGIKFFDSRGFKLSDEMEKTIETFLEEKITLPVGKGIGRVKILDRAEDLYIEYLKEKIGTRLEGIRVVVDCAYGAAYRVAPAVFDILGADVLSINNAPLGEKINVNCGATHPEVIRDKVKDVPSSIGVSFDGDADRVVLADEEGNILNGDYILALWGIELLKRGELKNNTVVGTIMSNLGLEEALASHGATLLRAEVGDRYVLEKMFHSDSVIGGEPSGHIVYLPGTTTGDGIFTSLMVLKILKEKDKPLSAFRGIIPKYYPQISRNIRVRNKYGIMEDAKMKDLIAKVDRLLIGKGRSIIRASGTEDFIRVTLEGEDDFFMKELINEIEEEIRKIDNAYNRLV
ncbi:MAG: phosphoglucosamine mutase [bacterium]